MGFGTDIERYRYISADTDIGQTQTLELGLMCPTGFSKQLCTGMLGSVESGPPANLAPSGPFHMECK